MKVFLFLYIIVPAWSFVVVQTNNSWQQRTTPLEAISTSRRQWMAGASGGLIGAFITFPTTAWAKEKEAPTHANVKAAYDALRTELSDPQASIGQMQTAIDTQDWVTLLDITKEYDQGLRKGKVGRVKKLLPKELSSDLTTIANSITFNLIGINRNARRGQENPDEANRYLNQIRSDLQKVLETEKDIIYVD